MIDAATIMEISLHAAAGLALGYGLLRIYRWIRAQSSLLGIIVGTGLVVRATLGLLLFWISYLNLPILRSLQSGDGFWALAPDAVDYTLRASQAVREGLSTIAPDDVSPAYVRLLAIWMHVVGVSPASGMFLNLALFGLLSSLIVFVSKPCGNWRHDLPCAVVLAGFSCAPLQTIHGTQSLKDDAYAVLLAVACIGAWLVLRPVSHADRSRTSVSNACAGLSLLLVTLYLMAGMRTDHALLVWASLAVALVFAAVRGRLNLLGHNLAFVTVILILTCFPAVLGAWPHVSRYPALAWSLLNGSDYVRENRDPVSGRTAILRDAFNQFEGDRMGFEEAVGTTNTAGADATRAQETGPLLYINRLTRGLATIFVPISILRALSVVQFTGGRGLLLVTDIDTLFLDATMIGVFMLLYMRRSSAKRHLAYVLFVVILSSATALLLGYVVTNFGTLVRLRMMAVVPLWMACLAAAGGEPALRPSAAPVANSSRRPGP